MKILFFSDIHGSVKYTEKLFEIYDKECPDKMVLLGDYLYHGPRNPLTEKYNTIETFDILNENKEKFIAVKGNCDADVDELVLDFKLLENFMIYDSGKYLFCSHGHIYNPSNVPDAKIDFLINGHTHIYAKKKYANFTYINPGSISLPKDDEDTHSYAVYENGNFTIKDIDGKILI